MFKWPFKFVKTADQERLLARLAECELEIEKTGRYRTDFAANVSHELKTPLTAIGNYVETLLNGAIHDNEKNVEFLKKIQKHAVNLSNLIDDVLEVARLDDKKEPETLTRLDLEPLVSRAVETIAPRAKRFGLNLLNRILPRQFYVNGSEDLLYRAILNLLDNAVKYTNQGTIEIAGRVNQNTIELSVSDTGIGISTEHLNRIFERFYRVDKARSRELGGTGLGLSLVKHTMNVHGGSVRVESEVGRGSRFTLVFTSL